jgi:hypothetical protein
MDAFFAHWFLGLHRIRMGAENPLIWDLLWFAIFGLIPLALGLLLSRNRRQEAAQRESVPARRAHS